jgi:Fe-S-cluster containining protein
MLDKNWKQKGKDQYKQNKQFLQKAKRMRGIEKKLPDLHEQAFKEIDCLDCAGCCKNISPRFKTPDITRVSKYLGMKESAMIGTYLRLDHEGDYVVKSSPCPFLGSDNYCSIYEARPGDCRKYPYTDSGDFFDYPTTTMLNTTICPAVVKVLELLQKVQ